MPLYEYRCDDCQASFEILQRMGEGPGGLACPECGGTDLAKQFSTFAASSSPAVGGGRAATAPSGCGAGGGFT